MVKRKKKICIVCGNPEYLFSQGMCKRCWSINYSKPINSVISDDLSGLIEDADALFSKWIRMKDADVFDMVGCYTCGAKKRWPNQQCGHYISRSNLYLRWDARNAKVQCEGCNCLKNGNISAYTKRLELENPGITGILLEEARIVYKPTRDELKAIISEYSKKIKMIAMIKSNS